MKGIDAQQSMFAHAGDLRRDGFGFVGRYLNTTKNKTGLTRAEADHLHGQGLKVLSIFELDPTSAGYFTYEQGVKDGKSAKSLASAAGQPAGGCVFFTADYDAAPNDIPGVKAYFEAVRSVLMPQYVPGVYGSGAVCSRLWDAGLVRATWLAQSTKWTGYSAWWPKAQIVQGIETVWHGVDVDLNVLSAASLVW